MKPCTKRSSLFSLSLILILSLTTTPVQSGLLTTEDFEAGNLSQLSLQKAQKDSITLVNSPVRAGKFAARTLLRTGDPKVHHGQRTEFSDSPRITKIEMGKDYWYGLSIFLPDDFVAPTRSSAVLFQWHTQEGGPSPVLAIRACQNDWILTTDATDKRRQLAIMPLAKNRWTDWVVHVRWSSEPTGFWTIWQNGVEVLNEHNVVTQRPEELGPYAKFGQYHSVSEVPQNVVYFDEYRVAGPDGNYAAVAPPDSQPLQPRVEAKAKNPPK